jgi:uncharacterized protein
MPRIITYSLCQDNYDSNFYYRDIARFADAWLTEALPHAGELIAGFRDYRKALDQPDRSESELVFELLALGVLLCEHGDEAAAFPAPARAVLDGLQQAQARWPRQESLFKALRGWVGRTARLVRPRQATGSGLAALIAWLKITGENGRAERLAHWQAYFKTGGDSLEQAACDCCQNLAADFAETSLIALSKYTENVWQFLIETAPRHRWKYDAEFVSRTRLEYHLGMLGTEVLNRAYRQRFLASEKKVVIVPPCMRIQPEEKCLALASPMGAKCQACTPGCRVNRITQIGEEQGFAVYIIPDQLRVFQPGGDDGSLGVVGVSCALTNWSGGWDADALGIPAQGVLLDYVGCTYHWDMDGSGIPTGVNLNMLLKVIKG